MDDSNLDQDTVDLLDRVKYILNKQFGGSQTKLAEATSLSQPTVNRTLNLESDYGENTRKRNLRAILGDLSEGDELGGSDAEYITETGSSAIQLPRVSFKASAGDGSYVTEQEYEGTYIIDPSELKGVRPSELRDGMFVIEAEGDSMVPDIHPGEQLIIKPVEAPDRIASDAIYLFRLEKRVQIKRLQAFPGGRIRVKSKNTDYDDYELDLDAGHDFEILGLVWGRFERLA